MDKAKAARSFLTCALKLPYLPFITEDEMRRLFGEEMASALESLEEVNRSKDICGGCGGKCCQEMQCELYALSYGGCPIYKYRPVLCRLNYCAQFGAENKSLVLELRDVGVEAVSLLEADDPTAAAIELNMLLYGACRAPNEPAPAPIQRMKKALALKRVALGRDEVEATLRRATQGHSPTPTAL